MIENVLPIGPAYEKTFSDVRKAVETGCKEVKELENENDIETEESIVISRARLATSLRTLFMELPQMLSEHSESMPIYMRAALPMVRSFLESKDMQETLTSDTVVDYVWGALSNCQV